MRGTYVMASSSMFSGRSVASSVIWLLMLSRRRRSTALWDSRRLRRLSESFRASISLIDMSDMRTDSTSSPLSPSESVVSPASTVRSEHSVSSELDRPGRIRDVCERPCDRDMEPGQSPRRPWA